jgi:cytochrome c-type biogenesis protein CcmH/NrfG
MKSDKETTRLDQLQNMLALCPTDILARCELASLLEGRGELDEAVRHWKAVLESDQNNLQAREGLTRCRRTKRSERSEEPKAGPGTC